MQTKESMEATGGAGARSHVQVSIPFAMLVEPEWQELFLSMGLNPEIGLDAAVLERFSDSDFACLAEKLHAEKRSITLHGPFLDLSPGSPDPAIRRVTLDRFTRMLSAIEAFRPVTVVCHAGYDAARYEFCREEWLEHSRDTWQRVVASVRQRGARLMLENVYEREPGELLAVIEGFSPDTLGCCLDVGHQSVFGHAPLCEWIERLSPCLGQLHLHDNHGDLDAHLGMGNGSIDFEPVFEFLSAGARLPVITLEPHQPEELLASLSYLESRPPFSRF
jgi:sugar phosphate isomerase/epimerase